LEVMVLLVLEAVVAVVLLVLVATLELVATEDWAVVVVVEELVGPWYSKN